MNIFNKIICLFLHLLWYKTFSYTYVFTTLKSLQNTLVLAQCLILGNLSNGPEVARTTLEMEKFAP